MTVFRVVMSFHTHETNQHLSNGNCLFDERQHEVIRIEAGNPGLELHTHDPKSPPRY